MLARSALNLSDPTHSHKTTASKPARTRIAVLVSGNGSNLQSIIDHIEAGKLDAVIACVVSNRENAFALERAKKHHIPTYYVNHRSFPDRTSFDANVVALLAEHKVDLVVLAGFNRILSHVMLDAFPMAILNIHPALLPAFPGGHAQRQALQHGAKIAGCTVHYVDSGTDTGPIIAQAAVPVLDNDTEESLSRRILREEHRIYPGVIQLYVEGRIRVEGRRVFISPVTDSTTDFLENPRF
jgi:phosphoribosylglycinamide formyltransferase-1